MPDEKLPHLKDVGRFKPGHITPNVILCTILICKYFIWNFYYLLSIGTKFQLHLNNSVLQRLSIKTYTSIEAI